MKKLGIIMMLLISTLSFTQEQIGLQFTQDAKLALVGDGNSYGAGTLDITISVQLQGDQRKWGYMVFYPEFEYADLKYNSYKRWTLNAGYTLNKLILNDLEMGGSVGYGFIDRGLSGFCWSFNAWTKYKINKTIKIVANLQVTERPDLGFIYGDDGAWRYSGQLGVEINIFKPNTRNKLPYSKNKTNF
jgi:hypothetical protein